MANPPTTGIPQIRGILLCNSADWRFVTVKDHDEGSAVMQNETSMGRAESGNLNVYGPPCRRPWEEPESWAWPLWAADLLE